MSNYSSYQTGGASITSGSDGEFKRVSQTVSTNIQKISQNVNSIKRMVTQLGTQADSEAVRQRLHEIQHYTNQLAKDTNKHLKDLNNVPLPTNPSEQRQRKLFKERLMSEFSSSLNEFQVAQRKAADKEKASMKRARAHSTDKVGTTYDEGYTGGSGAEQLISFEAEKKSEVASQATATHQVQLQVEEDVSVEELVEREKAIRQLESDIMDVNQIFKDLGMMVHEQGEVIDSIEANVESASMAVTEGAHQLGSARNYQNKARKKKICILVLLLLAAGILALVIWLSVRN